MLKRIGVLGGSFDPPHLGHIICSLVVAEHLDLKKIILMPVAKQPQRLGGTYAGAEERYRMVEAISEIDPIFSPSRLELDRSGISYTVDTIEQLSEIYPSEEHQLYWIIGMDAAILFDSWREPAKIVDSAKFAVMHRPGFTSDNIPVKWRDDMIIIPTPQIDISSTIVRQRISKELPIRPWVGENVEKIIRDECLYIS
mgnify:CR=1 FL=1